MRLWNKNEAPVGGLWYKYSDDKGNEYRVNGFEVSWNNFINRVKSDMKNNNVQIPSNLAALIEDQVCTRQPKGKCYYEKKAGDLLSAAIHTFARTADATASALGFNTQLEKKARGCGRCSYRRTKMNG